MTYTPRILDILKQKGIRATFYLQGAYLTQAYQDVIVRILKEGHEIGLHSLDHSQLNKDHGKMAAVYERQVGETEARLRNMTTTPDMPNGYTTSLYRPAYGSIRNDQIEYFAQQGKKIINWSIDTRDWDKNQSGDFMARLVGDGARGGDIVLMHSGGGNRARTVAALPQMLERLQKRNFIFMTTTEITAPVASPKKRSASTN